MNGVKLNLYFIRFVKQSIASIIEHYIQQIVYISSISSNTYVNFTTNESKLQLQQDYQSLKDFCSNFYELGITKEYIKYHLNGIKRIKNLLIKPVDKLTFEFTAFKLRFQYQATTIMEAILNLRIDLKKHKRKELLNVYKTFHFNDNVTGDKSGLSLIPSSAGSSGSSTTISTTSTSAKNNLLMNQNTITTKGLSSSLPILEKKTLKDAVLSVTKNINSSQKYIKCR